MREGHAPVTAQSGVRGHDPGVASGLVSADHQVAGSIATALLSTVAPMPFTPHQSARLCQRRRPLRGIRLGRRRAEEPRLYYNLAAHPMSSLRWVPTLSRPSPPSWRAERDALFARHAADHPEWAQYQIRTSRKFPVIALTRK